MSSADDKRARFKDAHPTPSLPDAARALHDFCRALSVSPELDALLDDVQAALAAEPKAIISRPADERPHKLRAWCVTQRDGFLPGAGSDDAYTQWSKMIAKVAELFGRPAAAEPKIPDDVRQWYGEHGYDESEMRLEITKRAEPKFPKTHCSQCGGEFGPGDHGYSHCEDHRADRGKTWPEVRRAKAILARPAAPEPATEVSVVDAWIERLFRERSIAGFVPPAVTDEAAAGWRAALDAAQRKHEDGHAAYQWGHAMQKERNAAIERAEILAARLAVAEDEARAEAERLRSIEQRATERADNLLDANHKLQDEAERLCVHGAEPTGEEWQALREERQKYASESQRQYDRAERFQAELAEALALLREAIGTSPEPITYVDRVENLLARHPSPEQGAPRAQDSGTDKP